MTGLRLWLGVAVAAAVTATGAFAASVGDTTLGVSSPIYSAVSGWHFVGETSASPVASAGGTVPKADCSKAKAHQVPTRIHLDGQVALVFCGAFVGRRSRAGCSKATASQAMTRYRIGVTPFQKKTPVYQVLCGAFFGPGSRGMVGSVAIPSCGGSVGWAVFRWAGGTWRLVMNVKHGAFLDAVGSDIREKIGVLGPRDGHCFPSSVKYRFWRWNGRALKAGPWARALSFDSVISSDGNIWCGFMVYPTPEARCASRAPVHTARLRRNGSVRTCDTSSDCLKGFEHKNAHVLPYGQANEWNEFHCLAETKGITCTVIGGTAAGKGFLINRDGVSRVGQ